MRDSAEDLSNQAAETPKHVFPLEDLAPQAGTVGIELVDQSFVGQVTSEHHEAMVEMIGTSEQSVAEQSSNGSHSAEADSAEQSRPGAMCELQDISNAGQHMTMDSSSHAADTMPSMNAVCRDSQDFETSSARQHAVLIADSEEEHKERNTDSKQDSAAAREVDRVWFRERPVQLTIFGYTLIAFLYNCSDELIPLFAAAPPSIGGVGLLANQLAVPLVLSGVVLMWYAVYGYPWFQRKYGAIISCRIGLLATAPFILLIPVAHYFSASVVAAQVVLCLVLSCKAMAATNSFSASMILVNNAAPMHALGKVNGTGQMLASFVRAVGPALAGAVWGSTASLGLPGSQFISFTLVAVIACLTQFVYVFVKLPTADR